MQSKVLRGATASLFIAALAACGGGGGSATPPGTPTSTTLTVTGTAATGLAIPGATVTGKCKVGTGTATTLADGSYALMITDGQLPCVLQITNPVDGIKLHTVVTGTGSTATANITPLTEMVTARVLGSEPNVYFAAFDAAVAVQKITSTTVKAAQTDVGTVLTGSVDTSALADFISTPLKAATQSNLTGGDAQDKLLDALRVKINTAQLTQVIAALAHNPNTAGIKQVVVSFAAVPPKANAGVNQSVVVGATVNLDGSASTADSGQSLTYVWSLITPINSNAKLSNPSSAKPTFLADKIGTYIASLVVSDGNAYSAEGYFAIITATVGNAPPVANAQNAVIGKSITFDGSASTDANGDTLTYSWTLTTKPTGSLAILSDSTSAKPIFTADVGGNYVASLVVNDGKVNSTPITTTASVITPLPIGAGTFAYGGSYANAVPSRINRLDESTGLLYPQPIGCSLGEAADLTPDGIVVSVGWYLNQVDVLTGVCKQLFKFPDFMSGIAVAPDGTIVTTAMLIETKTSFGVTTYARSLYRFSPNGELLGKVAVILDNYESFNGALDFAPDGKLYYVTYEGRVYEINPITGVRVFKALLDPAVGVINDIDIDSNGTLRTISGAVLKLYSTVTWKLISSRLLEQDYFTISPVIHR